MPAIHRIVLDVLKPHLPNLLEFAESIASLSEDYQVGAEVLEMDEKTETLALTIEGEALDYGRIEAAIGALGGSVHSIDACLVVGGSAA